VDAITEWLVFPLAKQLHLFQALVCVYILVSFDSVDKCEERAAEASKIGLQTGGKKIGWQGEIFF
jgi:hypothetical protein